MENEIPIFKPRYSLRTRLMSLGLPAVFFALMCGTSVSFVNFPAIFWMLALVLGLYTSLVPFLIIREIRFANEMVVRRHFLPDRFIAHKELEHIDNDSIQAGGQRIRMGQIVNLDELKDMSHRWKAARILKESQPHKPRKESIYFQSGYGTYASFWGLMFGIIIMLMQPSWLQFDSRWLLGGTFLLVYFAYIYILPKYL